MIQSRPTNEPAIIHLTTLYRRMYLSISFLAVLWSLVGSDSCTKKNLPGSTYFKVKKRSEVTPPLPCKLYSLNVSDSDVSCDWLCMLINQCYNVEYFRSGRCIFCLGDPPTEDTGLTLYNMSVPEGDLFLERQDGNDCVMGLRCYNGGTCVDGSYSFTCVCPQGYTGAKCQHTVTFNETLTSNNEEPKTFSEIFDTLQQQGNITQLYSFTDMVWHITMINNFLWAPVISTSVISVLDMHTAQKVKDISHPNIRKPKSVALHDGNTVLVACAAGLFAIDVNGNYLYEILQGTCSDVKVYGNDSYAYESVLNDVLVLSFVNNQWVVNKTFPATHTTPDNGNTLELIDQFLYISSQNDATISVYALNGRFMTVYGQYSKTTIGPGLLRYTSLCGVQGPQKELLVCNGGHQNIQILSTSSGKWKMVSVAGMGKVLDAVVQVPGNAWLLWQDSNKNYVMVKYSV